MKKEPDFLQKFCEQEVAYRLTDDDDLNALYNQALTNRVGVTDLIGMLASALATESEQWINSDAICDIIEQYLLKHQKEGS